MIVRTLKNVTMRRSKDTPKDIIAAVERLRSRLPKVKEELMKATGQKKCEPIKRFLDNLESSDADN